MYCTKCGSKNIDDAVFCTNCGSALSGASSPVPVPPKPTISQQNNFDVKKIFGKIITVLAATTVLGGLAIGLSGNSEQGKLISVIVNWLLGVFFAVSVLGLIGGFIAGIVFLTNSGENETDKAYNKKNALWSFLGPTLVIVWIIFSYVVISVVTNLTNPKLLK